MERRQLLLWCEIAQCRMQAPPIVPALQELEDIRSCLIVRQVVALLDEFALQRGIEALHRRVVPAIALAAHRADDAVLLQSLAILVRRRIAWVQEVVATPACSAFSNSSNTSAGVR